MPSLNRNIICIPQVLRYTLLYVSLPFFEDVS
jgi:hypothetical protein